MANIVLDFDGTFVNCETIDELARIALRGKENAEEIREQVAKITREGMSGDIPYRESITKRLELVQLHRDHIAEVIDHLKGCISPSFVANKEYFQEHIDQVYIISNGFKEVIEPVVELCGIGAPQVYASNLEYDEEGFVIGVEESILLEEGGKGHQLATLELGEDTVVVGDGYTDYLMKKVGGAKAFIAYIEHVRRDSVTIEADFIAESFDEVISYITNHK